VKVDFAGLFGQLFKLAPHGLATRRPGGMEAPGEATPGADQATPAAPPGDPTEPAPDDGDPPR